MPIKIEKNIPLTAASENGEYKKAMLSMDVGDSFLVDKKKRGSLGYMMLQIKSSEGKEFKGRSANKSQIRIWRTK